MNQPYLLFSLFEMFNQFVSTSYDGREGLNFLWHNSFYFVLVNQTEFKL